MFKPHHAFIFMALSALPMSALAIDCSKATTKDETALCSSPALMQLDAVLNKGSGQRKTLLHDNHHASRVRNMSLTVVSV